MTEKPTAIILPSWNPDEPRFVVETCEHRIAEDREFMNNTCVFNQRLGFAYSVKEIVEVLNNMRDKIDDLEKENEQLRQMIKENVFGRYNEGSLADLEFKAISYDDIIKLEMSNESEPKVVVICRQGKKENVKSFCQMFIPFGIAYEIKEMIEDE